MGKHSKKEEHQIIQLRDYQEPPLPPEDGPGEEGPDSGASITYEDGKGKKPAAVPKAVYRAAVILLVLVVALALWMNRTSLNPESIGSWLKLQITGAEIGDGFPVQITGSEVQEANFLAQGGNAVVLSDTVFSILNPTGREELSLRHSLNHPVLQEAGGRFCPSPPMSTPGQAPCWPMAPGGRSLCAWRPKSASSPSPYTGAPWGRL